MTGFIHSPRLIRAGFVRINRTTGAPREVIRFQYNPDQLTRSLQLGEESGRSPGVPPVESLRLEAEFDANDDEGVGKPLPVVVVGVAPRIAALAALVTPEVAEQLKIEARARRGILELAAPESALLLFKWGPRCIAPVRITEFSATEEAFSVDLTPTRAKVSLGLRILRPFDLGFAGVGGGLALAYQYQREALALIDHGDSV